MTLYYCRVKAHAALLPLLGSGVPAVASAVPHAAQTLRDRVQHFRRGGRRRGTASSDNRPGRSDTGSVETLGRSRPSAGVIRPHEAWRVGHTALAGAHRHTADLRHARYGAFAGASRADGFLATGA